MNMYKHDTQYADDNNNNSCMCTQTKGDVIAYTDLELKHQMVVVYYGFSAQYSYVRDRKRENLV